MALSSICFEYLCCGCCGNCSRYRNIRIHRKKKMAKITTDVADTWFSKYIRLRDKKCMRCGSPVEFKNGDPISHQCSHFKGRRSEATRFDPDNCDSLCYGCHQYFHEHEDKHKEWKIGLSGQKLVDEVILRANSYKRKDRKMEALIWKQAYKDLKDENK